MERELYCRTICQWLQDPSLCWYEWQTLVGGTFAIAAAAVGYLAVRRQIQHAEEIEARRLKRLHMASRFVLQHTLSTATHYANDVISGLSDARNILKSAQGKRLSGSWSPPVFPAEVLDNIRRFIETSYNEPVNYLIGELLKQLQILSARQISLIQDEENFRIGIGMNIAQYQLQAAKIIQICGELFQYARGETETVASLLDRETVVRKLEFNSVGEGDQDFETAIEAFKKVDRPWWVRPE